MQFRRPCNFAPPWGLQILLLHLFTLIVRLIQPASCLPMLRLASEAAAQLPSCLIQRERSREVGASTFAASGLLVLFLTVAIFCLCLHLDAPSLLIPASMTLLLSA